MTHIQKTAPGPPTTIAVATPARLPVPTRLASDTAKAWNEETWRSPPGALPDGSPSTRTISRSMRNCTPRVRRVNHTAQPSSAATSTWLHRMSLMLPIQPVRVSIVIFVFRK